MLEANVVKYAFGGSPAAAAFFMAMVLKLGLQVMAGIYQSILPIPHLHSQRRPSPPLTWLQPGSTAIRATTIPLWNPSYGGRAQDYGFHGIDTRSPQVKVFGQV